jgi:hypothetical protein
MASKRKRTLADELAELTNPEPTAVVDAFDYDTFGADTVPRLADDDADVGDGHVAGQRGMRRRHVRTSVPSQPPTHYAELFFSTSL